MSTNISSSRRAIRRPAVAVSRKGPLPHRFSDLTAQEKALSAEARVDLGAGYPHTRTAEWVLEIMSDPALLRSAYSTMSDSTFLRYTDVQRGLLRSVCRTLGMDEAAADHGFVTHSGSLAINRAVAATVQSGDHVITTNPSIDITTAMILERGDVDLVHVGSRGPALAIDVEAIARAMTRRTRVVIVASPENPTGVVLKRDELQFLATQCAARRITLIMDQCFAKVNPFGIDIPILGWRAASKPGLQWAMLWDTGKTFGLNEDKLAFVFCSPSLHTAMQTSFNSLQFDVSRRLQLCFTEILNRADSEQHYAGLGEIVRLNMKVLEDTIADNHLPVRLIRPEAGSLVLMDISAVPAVKDDIRFSSALLGSKRVGVLGASSFFFPLPNGELPHDHGRYVRIALARDPAAVALAAEGITAFLTEKLVQ